MVRKKTIEYFKKTIENEGKDKSKVQYLLEGKTEWKPGKRPEYMNKLTRNQISCYILYDLYVFEDQYGSFLSFGRI